VKKRLALEEKIKKWPLQVKGGELQTLKWQKDKKKKRKKKKEKRCNQRIARGRGFGSAGSEEDQGKKKGGKKEKIGFTAPKGKN